jgi:hypothetical protein
LSYLADVLHQTRMKSGQSDNSRYGDMLMMCQHV